MLAPIRDLVEGALGELADRQRAQIALPMPSHGHGAGLDLLIADDQH